MKKKINLHILCNATFNVKSFARTSGTASKQGWEIHMKNVNPNAQFILQLSQSMVLSISKWYRKGGQ